MLRKRKLLLFLILLLASFLRFWRLGSYPALNADEAAIGYNAYSLIETGKDEHGNAWPIHFQSFNDYKPGLYFYLVLPFVKVLGLSELAVRIPGALFGVATVLVVYFLCRELFPDKKLEIGNWKLEIGEFAALFLAISPWHIHFSRGGWEVNVATFFISLGLLLYLKGLKNPNYYALCTISFVLSLYTYHAARVVVPLLVIGLGLIYRKEIRPDIKSFIISGIAALILLAPLGFDIAKGEVGSRVAGVGLFADPGPLSRINEQRGEHQDQAALDGRRPWRQDVGRRHIAHQGMELGKAGAGLHLIHVEALATPRAQDHLRACRQDLLCRHGPCAEGISGRDLGKDVHPAGQADELAHPLDTACQRRVPFLEVDAGLERQARCGLGHAGLDAIQMGDEVAGVLGLTHHLAQGADHVVDAGQCAVVKTQGLHTSRLDLIEQLALNVRVADDQIGRHRQDLVQLAGLEATDLGLAFAGLWRVDREAGDADQTVLHAQSIKDVHRLGGQAGNALRGWGKVHDLGAFNKDIKAPGSKCCST